MPSTDIDGSPILVLSLQDVRSILRSSDFRLASTTEDKKTYEKLARFVRESDGHSELLRETD